MDAVRRVASVLRVEGEEVSQPTGCRRPSVARDRRGVPRPAPGVGGHAGGHAPRGGHPARPLRALSEETGCEVWLKYDGANPTGSFKDRGMTLAISKALEEGAKAVVCASTGNTSASAAAYAAKAGLTCAVLVPEGQGRARQDGADARPRRARARGRRQLRRVARGREGTRRAVPRDAREQRQPVPAAGTEDRGVRDRRRARPGRPTSTASRSGTPATSPATGSGTRSTSRTA